MSLKIYESARERELAEVLRLRRVRIGMDQKDLAARLGVSRQTVNKREAGEFVPLTLSRWDALARALGMKILVDLRER